MRYTFAQAEAFYWTARLGGFRAAALHLHLSQPTVSLRIKEMERILGSDLFDRSVYRPAPTALGRAIYGDIERLLAHAQQVEQRSRQGAAERRLLRLGAADSFAALILPDLLAALAKRHSDLQVDVTVDFSTKLERALLDRAIDIAFLSQPRAQDRVSVVPLWPIELVWVIGENMPFQGDVATPENLVALPIFTNGPASGLFTTIQTWFGTRGLRPLRLNTCNPLTVIARLASAGTGAALLPRELLGPAGEKLPLRILDADPPVPGHNFCAMWWHDEAHSEHAYLADLAKQIRATLLGAMAAPNHSGTLAFASD